MITSIDFSRSSRPLNYREDLSKTLFYKSSSRPRTQMRNIVSNSFLQTDISGTSQFLQQFLGLFGRRNFIGILTPREVIGESAPRVLLLQYVNDLVEAEAARESENPLLFDFGESRRDEMKARGILDIHIILCRLIISVCGLS